MVLGKMTEKRYASFHTIFTPVKKMKNRFFKNLQNQKYCKRFSINDAIPILKFLNKEIRMQVSPCFRMLYFHVIKYTVMENESYTPRN